MTTKSANAVLLFTLAPAAWTQENVGEQKPASSLPFTMTTVQPLSCLDGSGVPARWPHADHRKAWTGLAGIPEGREDPG